MTTFAPMNELSRHIERLLLAHDCVVVPQFGGFVTMATYATREETEGLFFPPIRVVRFNPDLMEDDGLLLADVREQRHCSDTEAKRHIQHMVLNLRQQLLADGQADFGSIGIFTQDEDGRVSFSPCQAGVITPAYFGLDAFAMPKLTAAQRSGKHRAEQQALEDEQESNSTHITIRISRRSLKNALAAAAIIVLCALFSSPVDDARQSNQATLLPSSPAVEAMQTKPAPAEVRSTDAPSNPAPVAKPAAAPSPAAQPTAAAKPVPAEVRSTDSPSNPTPAPAVQQTAKYCIVLASDVSKKNADNYVKVLQDRGFVSARVYNNGKMNRVVLGYFQTENEAYNMNAELHRTSREYASTWVMAL